MQPHAPIELHTKRDPQVTVLWNFVNIELGKMLLDEKTLPFVGNAGNQRCVWHYGTLATFNQEPKSSPRCGPIGVASGNGVLHNTLDSNRSAWFREAPMSRIL